MYLKTMQIIRNKINLQNVHKYKLKYIIYNMIKIVYFCLKNVHIV